MTAAGHGIRLLPYDQHHDRAVARLRLSSAIVVALCATAVLIAAPNTLVKILAIVGWLVAIGWAFAWLRFRKRQPATPRFGLTLSPEGLALRHSSTTIDLAWSQVTQIEVDEERLNVRLTQQQGPDIAIEPLFGGLGVYALSQLLEQYRNGAQSPKDG